MVVAVAPANAGMSCHNINANGVGQDVTEDPPPDGVDAQTVAQIRGGGLLQGTTYAEFSFIGPTTFVGELTFTTNRATLKVQLDGSLVVDLDTSTAEFTATTVGDPEGTGKLLNVESADLTFAGVQSLVDGSFTETVTGEKCVDLKGNGKN
jgi:hypothetical protein